jgi:ATP-binding cassette subfamily B protein
MAGDGFGAKGAVAQSTASGLPFAGIPPELRERADAFAAGEPDHGVSRLRFSHSDTDRRPMNLRSLLAVRWRLVLAVTALIVIEVAALQSGPLLTQLGIDRGIRDRNLTALVVLAGLYALGVWISMLAGRGRLSLSGRITANMVYDLRVRVFTHLQRLSMDYYTREKAGVIMSRMTSDIENLQQMLQDGLVQFLLQGLTMVLVTTVLFCYNVTLALITILAVLPLLIALSLWFRGSSLRSYVRVRDGIAGVLVHLSESLAGIRVVIGFNRQTRDVARHREVTGVYRDANDNSALLQAVYGPTSEAIGALGQVVILLIGARMVSRGELSVGELSAFILYLNAFFLPIQQLVQLYGSYQQGQASMSKLADLVRTPPSVREPAQPRDLVVRGGSVELRGVSFGYAPGRPVLHDVNLVIRPGETVCFVGPTGAGKSTITKLITRFYDPTGGAVLLDGVDLRELSLTSLRRQLGVVPQEPFLFVGTIRDNLAFARPDATEDELREAVRLVGLAGLIERSPQGLDTEVHERGVSLSSGERQLLALGRAFVARPRLLVLDEATSNLDMASEAMIEAAMERLLRGRTAIVVAHRLSTAMRADRIVVIDGGRAVEMGTHDELVKRGGVYAGMVDTWNAHR